MTQTVIQKAFLPIKRLLPGWLSNVIRNTATAFIVPFQFSYQSGHFRSCFKMAAVSKRGDPLPWYTYPCIDFLKFRDYKQCTVLEFGSGQSTLWWADRAQKVVALEGDENWYKKMQKQMPDNVELKFVSMTDRASNTLDVEQALSDVHPQHFDIIVIDGLYRENMIPIAIRSVSKQGMIICDNADGYSIYDGFKDSGLNRVDFFGFAPGVVLPHATSIYYSENCFAFSAAHPIPKIALEN